MSPSAEIRQIMSTEFLRLKGKNPAFSMRAFAKRIKLPVSAVSEIMHKNRSITPTMAERLLAELPVDPAQSKRLMNGLVAEKKAARAALVAGFLPRWAEAAERNIGSGPFFGGEKIHVVDLKLHMAVRWFIGGKVDHIPATIFAGHRRLIGVHDAVRDHPGVKSWYARG